MIMENDTDKIKAFGERMMQGFSVKNSSKCNDESCENQGFKTPNFDAKNMFNSMGKGMGMGLASEEDSDKLREMGKRMMGQ